MENKKESTTPSNHPSKKEASHKKESSISDNHSVKKESIAPVNNVQPAKKDTVEIPIGKLRENPWIISTIVLGVALILVIAFAGKASITGNTVNAQTAGEKVLNFLESNPDLQGQVELVSVEDKGQVYEVTLNFQGQDVPIYTTLDGQYLISDLVPIDPTAEIPSQQEVQPTTQPTQAQLSEDDDPVLGDKNAPITIIEFSDFQCPFCAKFHSETLPELKKNYIDTGKAKLIYRDYPLPNHPMAIPSALAAQCVFEQGGDEAYYKYHDTLFSNQAILSSENLIVWASQQGYNIKDCFESQKFLNEVNADYAAGGQLGTPTFFINGMKVEGAQPYTIFEQILESQI